MANFPGMFLASPSKNMLARFDIQGLTRVLESVSNLTGLSFSLYDDRQAQIIAPLRSDDLSADVRRSKRGQEEYKEFIEQHFRLALLKRDGFAAQGPTGQHQLFVPIHYRDLRLVALSEPFYFSRDEFTAFCCEKAAAYGVDEERLKELSGSVCFVPVEKVDRVIAAAQVLLDALVAAEYEKGDLGRKWQWAKTIIKLVTNIEASASVKDIHRTIIDAIIFLFGIDTAAVFSRQNGHYAPEVSGGRNVTIIGALTMTEDNRMVQRMAASRGPVSSIDAHELIHAGFPEEIISAYLFPFASESRFFGFLGVFNSLLDKEAFSAVDELCRLSVYLYESRYVRDEHRQKSDVLGLLSLKTSLLYFLYKDPGSLHNSIVREASSLVNAEKCSLMLPDDDRNVLRISAVKGFNRWLMEDVQVRAGEGIAGKAYEQGAPILIEGGERFGEFAREPKPQYATASSLTVPLKIADEVLGILNVSDKRSGEPFSERDLTVLTPFALQASILLKLSSFYTLSEQMREQSVTDFLTGLFNRRFFNIRLEDEHQRAKRYGLPLSMAIVDIDDFKLFNDTEGHLAGDEMLKEIASIMSGMVRANDILVRFGGEEFAIIMPQTTRTEAFHVSERIRESIKHVTHRPWKHYPKKHITVCIGLAMYPDCGEPIEKLIREADRALYRAKMQGKDTTVVFDKYHGSF